MQNFDNEYTILSMIESMANQFTKTDWRIAQFIKQNPRLFVESAALEIAAATNTSDASVIRFAQKIGFKGFYEMRLQLQKELDRDINSDKSRIELMERDYIVATQRSFSKFSDERISQIAVLLKRAKYIYICSFNQYSYLTNLFSIKLISKGIHALPITNINDFGLVVRNSTQEYLFIILTNPSISSQITENVGLLHSNQSSLITISKMVNEFSKIDHMHLSIPIISDTLSNTYISDDSLYMIMFDILYFAVSYC